MQSEDRVIHFSVELIHAATGLRKDALQQLYFDLSRTKAAYDNTDFSNPVQARFHSRRGQRAQSVCLFLPDRLLIVEEWADMPLSTFCERVEEVGERALVARGQPRYLVHAATVRSTLALTHHEDARQFLLDHVCQQAGRIQPYFQRPVAQGGLRFALPETEDQPGNLNVIIESYRHSRREVYVEVKGLFQQHPVAPGQMGTVVAHVRAVRDFIAERVQPYLAQYDHGGDAPPPDAG